MAINLHTAFDKRIAQAFKLNSLLEGRLSDAYTFEGVRTVKVSTLVTSPFGDYTRSGSNRYGSPTEVQDTIQELTMSQDKSWTQTIDKGNYTDQSKIKVVSKFLGLEIKEQAIPMKDKYGFGKLAQNAYTIASSSTALTSSTAPTAIITAANLLDDAEVPENGRTLYVSANVHALLVQANRLIYNDQITEKANMKNVVGTFAGMQVVKVPSARLPKGMNFMIVHRDSAVAPTKIYDKKLHEDPPGLSGILMELRIYHDLFVIGARANGIYLHLDTSAGDWGGATALTAPAINASTAVITVTSGCAAKYTWDGTDPRYSATALTGAAPTIPTAAGTYTLTAYQFKDADGTYPSPLAAKSFTVA